MNSAHTITTPIARKQIPAALLALVTLVAHPVATAIPARAADVFEALEGAWSGSGNASFENGAREALLCTADYRRATDTLKLTLRCASPSAAITLSGALAADGSRVSGTWTESAFDLTGTARGTLSVGAIRLQISGGADGTLTLLTAGASHSVAFTTRAATLRAVNVSLRRR